MDMDIFNDPVLAEMIREDRAEVVGTCPHCGHDVYPSQLYPGTDPAVQEAYESAYAADEASRCDNSYAGFFLDDWVRVNNVESPYYNQVGRCVNFTGNTIKVALLRAEIPIWFVSTELELIVERRPVPPAVPGDATIPPDPDVEFDGGLVLDDRVEVCNPRSLHHGQRGTITGFDAPAIQVTFADGDIIWCLAEELIWIPERRPVPPEELT